MFATGGMESLSNGQKIYRQPSYSQAKNGRQFKISEVNLIKNLMTDLNEFNLSCL